MNDKETIISLLNEFANPKKMASFFVNNATPDFLFIRPSGNPINAKGFEQMITGDIVQEKAENNQNSPIRIFKRKYSIVHFYTRFNIYL